MADPIGNGKSEAVVEKGTLKQVPVTSSLSLRSSVFRRRVPYLLGGHLEPVNI